MPTLFKPSPRNLWAVLVVREPTPLRAVTPLCHFGTFSPTARAMPRVGTAAR